MKAPVRLEVEPGGIGWLVFDDPGRSANLLDGAARAALATALDELAAAPVRAAVAISAKERIFIAGADLREIAALPDAVAASAFSREGQRLFDRVASSRVPIVCAIHGACAGGGLEFALACQWRMATDAAATRIGLPETSLGLVPGWGGCVRLAQLAGPEAAIAHIIEAKLVGAAAAAALGAVDEVVAAGTLRERARERAEFLAANGAPTRAAPVPHPGTRRSGTRAVPGNPSPAAASEVVMASQHLAEPEAFEAEAAAFGRLAASAAGRNLIHVHFLREAARKRTLAGWFDGPPAPAAPIRHAGIVGAGVMGTGIAQLFAANGIDVVLRDLNGGLLARAGAAVGRLLDEAVARGRMSAEAAAGARARIRTTTDWSGFDRCELVVEAIAEDAEAKRKLFAEMAAHVPPDTILASNTSALPIEEIAGGVPNPDRALGLHFFNPAGKMPLVELILAPATSAAAAQRALALVTGLGKSPVISRSSPGFLVTRVLFFYLNEAVRLWETAAAGPEIDAALRGFGWPMGPLRLIDEVGIDITQAIFGELARYFPERFVPARSCARLLELGLVGRKAGAGEGFYVYGAREETNEAVARAAAGIDSPAGLPAAAIVEHLMHAMKDEAERVLAEGVVRSADDIDFALIAGAGFPACRGGLLWGSCGAGKMG